MNSVWDHPNRSGLVNMRMEQGKTTLNHSHGWAMMMTTSN